MKWYIEPTGCIDKINNNGDLCLQIRYSFYLEQTENGYDKRYLEVLKVKESAKNKQTLKDSDFEKTGVFENTPLHNHFIELPYNVTNSFISNIGNQLLKIVSDYNDKGYFDGGLIHIPNSIPRYDVPDFTKTKEAKIRIEQIKTNKLWLL